MKKHSLRKSFKSFFRSHVDPEKDEELKGTKSEIEGRVQKILNILKTEDDKEGKEKLTDMIKDFYNQYRLLFDRYDHLTEALRRRSQAKQRMHSSSSSSDSDSDSDDSPKEEGTNIGKFEKDFNDSTVNTKQELEIAYSLIRENETAIYSSREEEKSAEDLRTNIQQLRQENKALQLELEAKIGEFLTLKGKLESAEKEVAKLSQMHKDLELKIDSLSNLKDELDEELRTKFQDVTQLHEGKEKWKVQNSELDKQASNIQEGNKLREEKVIQRSKISELQKILTEREDEVIAFHEKLYTVQNEAAFQITALSEEVNHLLEEKEHLWSEKSQSLLEPQIERSKQESMESLTQLENQNMELQNRIRDQEEKLKEQEVTFVELSEEHKKLEVQLQNSEENLKTTEMKSEDMKEQFKDVDRLEESIEDLKRDLEMKGDEVSTLVENLRTTEVKLRLTSQKLRITEQILAEKEDSHRIKEEKLQEEQKMFVERVATMTRTIETYQKAQSNTAKEISEKVNDTLTGIDSFCVKFEEYYGHMESRIRKIMKELEIAKNWIKESNGENDHLKMEIANLIQQLKDEKEQELILRAKVGELETTMQKDANEKDVLTKIVKQGEEKMTELEKMIKEQDEKLGELEREMNKKDVGFLTLAEQKREAIKQLCIFIDYHRNRYDDLISKPTRVTRQIAT